jgi:tripartite-type tricarboxylate transporter receptor subunit TctC
MVHVPYKSTPQQLTDMVAGVAPLGFVQLATATPNVKAGKLIALAVTF